MATSFIDHNLFNSIQIQYILICYTEKKKVESIPDKCRQSSFAAPCHHHHPLYSTPVMAQVQ